MREEADLAVVRVAVVLCDLPPPLDDYPHQALEVRRVRPGGSKDSSVKLPRLGKVVLSISRL